MFKWDFIGGRNNYLCIEYIKLKLFKERESLFINNWRESKVIMINISICSYTFVCGVSSKLFTSYEWHFTEWSTLKMGHSSWATLGTERYRLIRRAERILKSYSEYWDFICKDKFSNYNLLDLTRFNTANNLHIFYRIEFGKKYRVRKRKHRFRQ